MVSARSTFTFTPEEGGEGGGGKKGEGWGRVLIIFWGGGVPPGPEKPLPYFRPKYTIFHTLFQTCDSQDVYCNCMSIGFTAYGTS